MRTTFRLIVGGPKCSQGQQSSDSSADSGSSPTAGGGLSGLAASAGGKLLGGLLAKRNQASSSDSTSAAAAANTAPPLPDGYVQVIAFTTETTAVTVAPVPPEQFEIPAGWSLEKPKPVKNQEYTCPTNDK